jgi:hypothetical protein
VSRKCCRSSPRCAGCPVRALAAARKHRELSETAALVTEILAGRAPRPLPAGVSAALEQLEAFGTRNGKTRAPAEAMLP